MLKREPELSKEYLTEHYIRLGENRYRIAEQTGVKPQRIGALLQKYGIRRYSYQKSTGTNWKDHPLNIMWAGMKERCRNKNSYNYKWYGGRGIGVCEEWRTFFPFYHWAIANGWEKGKSIDRIDGDGWYCPENCRFVTHREQCRNRKSNVSIEVDGVSMLQCEWEEYLGLRRKQIASWKHKRGIEYVRARLHSLLTEKNKTNPEVISR